MLLGGAALLTAAAALVTLAGSGIRLATAASVRVSGLSLAASGYPAFLQASDAPVDAGYESVWADVANLPGSARALLWVEQALPGVLVLGIAVTIGVLALPRRRGRSVARAIPGLLVGIGLAVALVAVAAPVVGAIARAEVVAFLFPQPGPGTVPDAEVLAPFPLDLAPAGWGVGIALLSVVWAVVARSSAVRPARD